MNNYPSLSNNAIVYRALLRKQWIELEIKGITPDAYYLRKKINELGLSVNIADHCSPEQCASKFKICYGVASIKVGDIRNLGLDVVADSPIHANIMGLPYRQDDCSKAERLADLLARISKLVWLNPNLK